MGGAMGRGGSAAETPPAIGSSGVTVPPALRTAASAEEVSVVWTITRTEGPLEARGMRPAAAVRVARTRMAVRRWNTSTIVIGWALPRQRLLRRYMILRLRAEKRHRPRAL